MSGQITQLLNAVSEGDLEAGEELLPLIYAELRRIARARMANERPGLPLQPTALVHEVYLKLMGDAEIAWASRRHFYATAAQAMRRILIDRARHYARERHGGKLQRASLADELVAEEPRYDQLIALDTALTGLEKQDQGMAEIVRLRFFAGLTISETAKVLGLSSRTVNRQWLGARAWLAASMTSQGAELAEMLGG